MSALFRGRIGPRKRWTLSTRKLPEKFFVQLEIRKCLVSHDLETLAVYLADFFCRAWSIAMSFCGVSFGQR